MPSPYLVDEALLRSLQWLYPAGSMTLEEVKEFLESVSVEGPDAERAERMYNLYHKAINEAGFQLAQKLRNPEPNS